MSHPSVVTELYSHILCHATWMGHSSPPLDSKFSYATCFWDGYSRSKPVEVRRLRWYYSLCLFVCLMHFIISCVNALHSPRLGGRWRGGQRRKRRKRRRRRNRRKRKPRLGNWCLHYCTYSRTSEICKTCLVQSVLSGGEERLME